MLHLPSNAFVSAARLGVVARLRGVARSAFRAYRSQLVRRAARRELYELDDRMLKDIGITRCEIEGIVRRPFEAPARRPSAIRADRGNHGGDSPIRRIGFSTRVQRFVEDLPERHGDVDPEVLKHVPGSH
jgi:uncharacterized protein YjiS (DUF1127 family)